MTSGLTKKHAEMFAGNLKTFHKYQSATVANGKSYLVLPVSSKITVQRCRYVADNTAGTDSAHSTLTVYKGTLAAIAAASAAGNLTGLTSVATVTFAAALAKTTEIDLTMTSTVADRDLDGSDTAPVGLCFYAVSPGSSDTVPLGTWCVEYVDRDEAP